MNRYIVTKIFFIENENRLIYEPAVPVKLDIFKKRIIRYQPKEIYNSKYSLEFPEITIKHISEGGVKYSLDNDQTKRVYTEDWELFHLWFLNSKNGIGSYYFVVEEVVAVPLSKYTSFQIHSCYRYIDGCYDAIYTDVTRQFLLNASVPAKEYLHTMCFERTGYTKEQKITALNRITFHLKEIIKIKEIVAIDSAEDTAFMQEVQLMLEKVTELN